MIQFNVDYTDKAVVGYFHMTWFKMCLTLFFHCSWIYLTSFLFNDKHFISHALIFILCITNKSELISFINEYEVWFQFSLSFFRIFFDFKPIIYDRSSYFWWLGCFSGFFVTHSSSLLLIFCSNLNLCLMISSINLLITRIIVFLTSENIIIISSSCFFSIALNLAAITCLTYLSWLSTIDEYIIDTKVFVFLTISHFSNFAALYIPSWFNYWQIVSS